MYWVLKRKYNNRGTNGWLFNNHNTLLCYTIELPWLDNKRKVSCIPEGSYNLIKRFSPKFGWHLHLENVKGRELILIHPANNAIAELKGCIAPVSHHTAWGTGLASRRAMQILMDEFSATTPSLPGEVGWGLQQQFLTIVPFK